MSSNNTLTLGAPSRGPRGSVSQRPSLCLVFRADAPLEPPRRFFLSGLQGVSLGRGPAFSANFEGAGEERRLVIRIPDPHVSTSHVRMARVLGHWVIEDAGSKNGTTVNGEPCQQRRLADGDLIEAGHAFLRFEAAVAETAPTGVDGGPLPSLATLSAPLAATFADLARVAPSDLPVILQGESGVGKDVAARALHQLSGRSGSLVSVNCGAIATTLLEATLFGHRRGAFTGATESRAGYVRDADRGTLFLDEVGELSPAAQTALLRVIQEREVVAVGETHPVSVDVRFVAASNRDLKAAVESGHFRHDLLARLAGLVVRLPPLRERRVDLGMLIATLLERVAPDPQTVRFTAPAAHALMRHDWPLNVRELEMCLRAAGQLAGWKEIDVGHLPEPMREAAAEPAVEPVGADDPERLQLEQLLREHGGNITAVARALQTSRMQVHRMLRRLGLAADDFRD